MLRSNSHYDYVSLNLECLGMPSKSNLAINSTVILYDIEVNFLVLVCGFLSCHPLSCLYERFVRASKKLTKMTFSEDKWICCCSMQA